MFQLLLCPHYAAECLIYFSLALAGAPASTSLNRTILCALAFVAVNLGVTATGTRKWYVDRFGEEAIRGRWNMVPFIW